MLVQHNMAIQFTEILCIGASITILLCLLMWLYLNAYYESFQKLCVKISGYNPKRKQHAFIPLRYSLWLKANTMAGAGAASLSQEAESPFEDCGTVRQREPVFLTQ